MVMIAGGRGGYQGGGGRGGQGGGDYEERGTVVVFSSLF